MKSIKQLQVAVRKAETHLDRLCAQKEKAEKAYSSALDALAGREDFEKAFIRVGRRYYGLKVVSVDSNGDLYGPFRHGKYAKSGIIASKGNVAICDNGVHGIMPTAKSAMRWANPHRDVGFTNTIYLVELLTPNHVEFSDCKWVTRKIRLIREVLPLKRLRGHESAVVQWKSEESMTKALKTALRSAKKRR